MSTALSSSPLRLPAGQARPAAPPPGESPRAWLEDLAARRFSGRVTFQRGDDLAELLLRGGQPLAAYFRGAEPLAGQQALTTLTGQPAGDWSCQVESLEPALLTALAGLGAEPQPCPLSGVGGLRALLRDLAQRGENGVLELSGGEDGERWARALLAEGRLLGSYSDGEPALAASLAPLGGLLMAAPRAHWFPAKADPLTLPPPVEALDGPAGAVERQVIWIVSRFEGDWGRARERTAPAEALEESLVRLLDSLLALAAGLQEHRGDAAALESILSSPIEVEARPAAEIDPRLQGLAAARACPILAELVADALQRVVLAFPDPNLTECCRQAALALQAELRAVFPDRSHSAVTDGAKAP